jgi:glyoxylate reductase
MHPILDPGPAILAEAAEVIAYPSNRPLDQQSIRQSAEGCVGIVSHLKDPIGSVVLSLPGLRCVSNVAVGFDNIDVPTATANHVWITNTPGVLDDATSDFAFALLMAVARRVVQGDTFVRQGNFRGWEIDMMLGADVHDATLGIVGIGRIGRGLARRAKGFNMRVLYSDTNPLMPEVEQQLGATHVDLPRLLAESDFISLHVPLTPDSEHLINAAALRAMKPTAVLINTARGGLVDEAALAAAIRAGEIGGAALDVLATEPPPADSPLLADPRVLITPHGAWYSLQAQRDVVVRACEDMQRVLSGRPPRSPANKPVAPPS